MRRGYLSAYFSGVGAKRLAAVDADPDSSNQHEVTGSKPLLRILGDRDRKLYKDGLDTRFHATYIWIGAEQEALTEDGHLSWYDSRFNDPTRNAEWRLYYQSNAITEMMGPGDSLFVARRPNDHLLFIVVPDASSIQSQLLWLFGIAEQPSLSFEPRAIDIGNDAELDFAARFILDELGIDAEEPEADQIDAIVDRFGLEFPTTRAFSELARSSLQHISPLDDPDDVLMTWMEREELMFRRLERRIVANRIEGGFVAEGTTDVEGFIDFSLSVQNRRKARMGRALENHLETIFAARSIRYVRGAETENGNRPDFLFPSAEAYQNPAFPDTGLTMLAAKSTLKDRWRQVLSEAERIRHKHLLTLEPGVSENQTAEMQAKELQLVVPKKLHQTYQLLQRGWLLNLSDFLNVVRERQLD